MMQILEISHLTLEKRKYNISSIRLGYESTMDDENVLLDITNGYIVIPNDFQGHLALTVRQVY